MQLVSPYTIFKTLSKISALNSSIKIIHLIHHMTVHNLDSSYLQHRYKSSVIPSIVASLQINKSK